MEISFAQSLKVWWSYTWRVTVMFIPMMILMMVTMMFISPFPMSGQPPQQLNPSDHLGVMLVMFGFWIVMMIAGIALQAHAFRWLLKAKWSNFKLVAVQLHNVAPEEHQGHQE